MSDYFETCREILQSLDDLGLHTYADITKTGAGLNNLLIYNENNIDELVMGLQPALPESGPLDVTYSPFTGEHSPDGSLNQFPIELLSAIISLSSSTQVVCEGLRTQYSQYSCTEFLHTPYNFLKLLLAFRWYIEKEICVLLPRQKTHVVVHNDQGHSEPETVMTFPTRPSHIHLGTSSTQLENVKSTLASDYLSVGPNPKLLLPTIVGNNPKYILEMREEYESELQRFQRVFRNIIPAREGKYTESSLVEAFLELDDSIGDLRGKVKDLHRKRRNKNIELSIRMIATAICFYLPADLAKVAGAVIGGSTVLDGLKSIFVKDVGSVTDDPLYFAYLLCEADKRKH